MTVPQSPFTTPPQPGPVSAVPAARAPAAPATPAASGPAPPPSISMPTGGGAIRGIGEKFSANAITGTASMSVPIALSKGRAGFGPVLALGYDSGRGNGVFGYGWAVNLPAVSRRTDKGLPRYDTGDTFVMSNAEDLVPVPSPVPAEDYPDGYVIQCFRPRIEGLFARIERWTRADGDVHWRSITKDNVTTIYGADAESRIFDPADPTRVFSWLVSSSFDPVGNAVAHEYVAEDGVGVDISQAHERRRTGADRGTQRHLKRIRYGNRVSRLADPLLNDPQWMFEVVFDYGDHDPDTPLPAPDRAWSVREDPFSSYRSGFEVRTYRLCQRVLMFHHFPDEAGVGTDCLVRVTGFTYAADAAAGTFLTAVTSRGYARSGTGYVSRAMPPVEFTYSAARLNDNIVDVDPASLENLPSGLSTPGCRWVDLDGEGVAGMLLAAGGGWYFKPNLGGARFGPAQPLPAVPSLAQTQVSLVDLAGDGQLDMVAFAGPTPGFAERTADGGWEPFRPFASLPALDWDDPNLRLADLDGDGHADVLITEDSALTWHASLAEDGFGPAVRVAAPRSEDNGPRLLFADGHGGTDAYAVHLADMSGDGLPDLVRIRNGEVCYWPNLGYGHFGRKVVMDLAPRLATDEIFDPRRVLLADVDGSGVTDLVYAGPREVRLYRNRSGNGFTEATVMAATPDAGAHATELTVADLLGTGTACLVWSSSLPGQERRSLHYLDLYGGVKPHLLTGVANNLGSRTNVSYAPSTDFYLADKAAGRPWQTRLPFPVQVVTRVETQDLVAGNRFVTEYTYHHGFFDGVEREFRGFGLVEQRDTERLPAIGGPLGDDVAASHVPPVLTRTWYHTGAFAGTADGLSARYATEYWPEDAQLRLPDTVWPPDAVAAEDLREACRALKGSLLRQEVYAEDGSDAQALPYSVTERSYGVDLLQAKGDNAHAVCFARPRETLSAHYERRRYDVEVNGQATHRTDPRVTHEVVLDVDEWGNVLRSATLAYGRRYPDADLDPLLDGGTRDAIRQAQTSPAATLTVSAYTNAVQTAADHRAPLPADVRTYELIHVTAPPGGPLSLDQVRSLADAAGDGVHDLPFEDVDAAGAVTAAPYRRLVEHNRVRYRRDDLAGALPPQTLAARGLVHESYQLAFTPGLLDVYQRSLDGGPPQDLLPQPAPVLAEGGYDYADGCWWIPSGQVRYSPGGADTPAQEFAHAVQHFFTPARHLDPFGAATVVTWDAYDLLVLDVRDPVGNRMSAGSRGPAATSDAEALAPALDYRVLAPRMTSDANRNRSAVLYDALGHVTASAAMGKPEEQLGDVLDGLAADVSDAALAAYFADPLTSPQALLGGATARMLIDLYAFFRTRDDPQPAPVAVAVLTRETHRLAATRIQHRLSYSDGFGREIQVKTQAEPGPGGPRWVGSGWVVHNNKGEQVRRYEPFFTATPAFELAYAAGVSPVACFDPLGRPVAVLGPDGTYTKTVFDPWRHETWDSNDTVLLDPRTDPDVAGFLAGFFATQPAGWQSWYQRRVTGGLGPREQQAAAEAAVHAATPGTGYADTLGRTVVTVAHNRYATGGAATEERHPVRAVFDVEGAKRQTVDARGNTVLRTVFDAAGRAIATRSPDAGNHWYVPDVAGVPVRRWDSRGFDARHGFDAARRPTHLWVTQPGAADPILAGLTVYGEQDPAAAGDNVRGRSRLAFDGAGLLISQRHDFKGNLLASRRQLANVFDATPDWSALAGLPAAAVEAAAQPLLEPQPLANASDYDALNRPTLQVLPDTTVVLPRYNEAGLLESLSARLPGSAGETPYVVDVDYDAHGRRVRVVHANDTVTEQHFDPLTFRLRRTVTTHGGQTLQDLSYVYDPVGNTVDLHDASQQTLFYDGQVTTPDTHYLLDALYRLIEATGREHASLGVQPDQNGPARQPLPHPNDPQAVRGYTQRYTYDPAGNILTMAHSAGAGSWTRTYTYATGSNRLLSHTVPGGPGSVAFDHDEHGNMVGMPQLAGVAAYDHHDQMISAGLGGGGTAHYSYDGAGNRRRRVLVRPGGLVEERIYLPGYEIHRRRMNGQPVFERQTVHIGVERPVALVETTTVDVADPAQAGTRRTRFQLRDQVGSASIELDQDAALISREEYHPYGTTSMWLATSQVEASPKRYRYTGKERDDETSLYYHGARYYLPWLARWASYDPEGVRDGESLYMYVKGNPIRFSDPDGADCTEEYKVPIWGALAPGHAGYAVRPQLNPCLKDHPGWQQWQAEADRKASIAAGSGLRVGHGVALGAATAATAATAVVYFGGVALGSVGLSAAEKATLWALTNPAKMALAETMLQFGIGLIDPHPPGGSPMDMPGPADDFGRLARASMVREIGQVHSAEEVVKISVRFMKPRQLLEAIKATWALDKQALAHWRGQIFEGVLGATRYKFMEWVGRFKNGYFATIDFYGQRVGIQVKTLNAVPDVGKYKGFIDALAAAKKAGVMEDGRPLSSVALHIWVPKGFTGPQGLKAQYEAAIKAIKQYAAEKHIPISVIPMTEEQLNLVVQSPK